MNLTRDKAIEAMDLLVEHGYSANIAGVVFKNHLPSPVYRVTILALSFDDVDLRSLCDLADSIGLHCRMSLQEIRFEEKLS